MTYRIDLSTFKDPEPLESGEWEFRIASAKYYANDHFDPDDTSDNPRNYKGRFRVVNAPVQPVDLTPTDDTWRGFLVDKAFFIKGTGFQRDLLDMRKLAEAAGVDVEGEQEPDDLCARLKDRRFIASVGIYTGKRGKENTLTGYRPAE